MDPVKDVERRASFWHINHQLLHDDLAAALPPSFSLSQILVDSDLSDQRSLTWWLFANHAEHYLANTLSPPSPSPFQP
jgi:hypothetical protein